MVVRNDKLIKISEMASLHGVSRQTLILYDKSDDYETCFRTMPFFVQ